jgi:hypothetical protein
MLSKPKEADVDTSMLDSEQLTALRLAQDLQSFFLTGDPGRPSRCSYSRLTISRDRQDLHPLKDHRGSIDTRQTAAVGYYGKHWCCR